MAKLISAKGLVEIKDGEPITAACTELGVPFQCYSGYCGVCRIKVIKGAENLSEVSSEELVLGKNERMACMCRILEGEVEIKW